MSLLIHKPGILASIQDAGRFGAQHWGVPISGAMDSDAMKAVNIICGNDLNAAVIECTLHGTVIEFQKPCYFALAGGGAAATHNEKPVDFYSLLHAEPSDRLQLHPSPWGCRTYLAISGGFTLVPELNSYSTYPLAALGGTNGKYLQSGDIIYFNERLEKHDTNNSNQSHAHHPTSEHINKQHSIIARAMHNPALHNKSIIIRLHKGPEWGWFTRNAQNIFTKQPWAIGANSNRMGYSLIGPALEKSNNQELISTAVTRGIVQVTPAGMPIVLMADAQTIGGYPRIARVVLDDLPILAQCRPGTIINFQLQ